MKNTLPPVRGTKEQLSADILMMMAGFYDQYSPAGDNAGAEALIKASKLVSDGIAEKLAKSLAAAGDSLSPETWKEMVHGATANAFIEMPDGGSLIKLNSNPSFAKAVTECTAKLVAPAGSRWARAVLEREEKELRKCLKRMKAPPAEVERLVNEWRARQRLGDVNSNVAIA